MHPSQYKSQKTSSLLTLLMAVVIVLAFMLALTTYMHISVVPQLHHFMHQLSANACNSANSK